MLVLVLCAVALQAISGDMQTIVNLLLSSTLIKAGDRHSYRTIVNRVPQHSSISRL
jgi:hypothetical protein